MAAANPPAAPGTAGLPNLGNTDALAAAVQVFAHCPQLVRAFVSGEFAQELNESNPLASPGNRVAKALAALVAEMWAVKDRDDVGDGKNDGDDDDDDDGAAVVEDERDHHGALPRVMPGGALHRAVRVLKNAMGEFNPVMAGYQRVDEVETQVFMLDAVHEDLNRVLTKPYVELPDSDGRPDAEVAAEAMAAHRQRNDSLLTDLFTGQLKSTIVCGTCGDVRTKFDPFTHLPLTPPAPAAAAVGGAVPLQECFSLFSRGGAVDDDVYCSKCKEFRRAEKKDEVWGVADYLNISFRRVLVGGALNEANVALPLTLDAADFALSPPPPGDESLYELYAMTIYNENGVGNQCIAQHHVSGDWYHFSDSSVTPLGPEPPLEAPEGVWYTLHYRSAATKRFDKAPLSVPTKDAAESPAVKRAGKS